MTAELDLSNAGTEVCAALVAAQAMGHTVKKDGWNKYSKYAYTTAEEMIRASRVILKETGLAVIMSRTLSPPNAGATDGQIGKMHVSGMMRTTSALVHSSGQWITALHDVHTVASTNRPNDKAEYAAATFVEMFVLRDWLLLDRNEDAEAVDQRPDGENALPVTPSNREHDGVKGSFDQNDDPALKFKRALGASGVSWDAVCEEAELTINGRPTDDELKQLWGALNRLKTETK